MRKAPSNIWDCVDPVVEGLGYEHVGSEYLRRHDGSLLRVYIDHADGISVDDCATVSRQLSAVLDVEEPIVDAYTLEVSSPGTDRPIFKISDYQRFIGQDIRLRMQVASPEGRKKFKGLLIEVTDETLLIEVDGLDYQLALDDVDEARLVPRLG